MEHGDRVIIHSDGVTSSNVSIIVVKVVPHPGREIDCDTGGSLVSNWMNEEMFSNEVLVLNRKGLWIRREMSPKWSHGWSASLLVFCEESVPIRKEGVAAANSGSD